SPGPTTPSPQMAEQPVQLALQDSPAGQPEVAKGGSQLSPGPSTPSPQLTWQAVQLALQDSPAGQPRVEEGGSQLSPGPSTPSPQMAEQPVQLALQYPPAGQPVGDEEGSHTSSDSLKPFPQHDAPGAMRRPLHNLPLTAPGHTLPIVADLNGPGRTTLVLALRSDEKHDG